MKLINREGRVEMQGNYVENTYHSNLGEVHYIEMKNDLKPLVMIHAQSVCGLSYDNVFQELSKKYHVFAVDCFGHGYSSHDRKQYNIQAIGDALIEFIKKIVGDKVYLTGHSSGGLIAAYIAANSDLCEQLILEDPPLFSCQGERRFQTYNYLDLSTVCHKYISEKSEEDFVAYYFENQKMWEFFPDKSRDKIKSKMVERAKKNREKHPERDLKIPFWPKKALSAYRGMNHYDPYFGEAFYNDSFHAGIAHEDLLKKIRCKTILMKAKTNYSDNGVLLAAMSDEDAERANQLMKNGKINRFDCGHGIHIEKKKEFLRCFDIN